MSAAQMLPPGPPGPSAQNFLQLHIMKAQAPVFELCLFLDQLGIAEVTLEIGHWRCIVQRPDAKPVIERPSDAQVIDLNEARQRRKE